VDKLMQVFEYQNVPVRVVEKDGEPWFVAADIGLALGLLNIRASIADYDADEKGVNPIDTPGGTQEMVVLSEAGLYRFLMRTDKFTDPAMGQIVRKFQRWVTHEVLPRVRKTGSYSLDRLPTHLETAKALVAALERQSLLEAKIEQDKPAVDFAHRVKGGEGDQNMNQVAKALGWGEIRLFAFLRDHQPPILMSNNMPLQRYIDRDYFHVVENVIPMRDGDVVKPQTLVTPKGLIWLQSVVPPFEANKKAHRSGKTKPEGHWPTAIAGARS
jgi:anti-repressor protein